MLFLGAVRGTFGSLSGVDFVIDLAVAWVGGSPFGRSTRFSPNARSLAAIFRGESFDFRVAPGFAICQRAKSGGGPPRLPYP